MTLHFRSRRFTPSSLDAEQRYAELTVGLAEVWQALYQVADPARRAVLADRGAAICRGLGRLAPQVFAVDLVAHAHDCMVLGHYAATERALADGELELPAGPDGSLIGHHPDVVLLWVELAASERRDRRAAVLLQLSATLGDLVGDDVARTLARLAETETRLVADAVRPRRRRSWPVLSPRRMAVVLIAVIASMALPTALAWPCRDRVVVGLVALAVGVYAAAPRIRPPRGWPRFARR